MIKIFIFFYNILRISEALTQGIIWKSKEQRFVSIYSIKSFEIVRKYFSEKNRELENHNFQNQFLQVGASNVRIEKPKTQN